MSGTSPAHQLGHGVLVSAGPVIPDLATLQQDILRARGPFLIPGSRSGKFCCAHESMPIASRARRGGLGPYGLERFGSAAVLASGRPASGTTSATWIHSLAGSSRHCTIRRTKATSPGPDSLPYEVEALCCRAGAQIIIAWFLCGQDAGSCAGLPCTLAKVLQACALLAGP